MKGEVGSPQGLKGRCGLSTDSGRTAVPQTPRRGLTRNVRYDLMSQAESAVTLPLPTRAMPLAQPVGTAGWMPVIYHPERTVEYLRFARFPRKTKLTASAAVAYAARVLWHRERRANEKRRRLEALSHPRYFRYFSEAAE